MPDQNNIIIQDLCQNNLKNISLKIPKEKLVVFTGVFGSGRQRPPAFLSTVQGFSELLHSKEERGGLF
ncbi:hypothetical protein D7X87_14180 [bacterium D16-54]|nr:hypothetical protein D7X87_14180 [bacterium D16-54]RKJ14916.1 hypothetical protein D7X65_09615 [bacterium D16-56]